MASEVMLLEITKADVEAAKKARKNTSLNWACNCPISQAVKRTFKGCDVMTTNHNTTINSKMFKLSEFASKLTRLADNKQFDEIPLGFITLERYS